MAIQVRCPTCGATMQAPAAKADTLENYRLAAKGTCTPCGAHVLYVGRA